ncbi:MAG TPA: hypothetical protein VL737_05350 [Candidatus Pristimantibacillus sp.]|nr:hypothetical protein [Candidatus Pristimantibacillus sp.]
MRLRSLTKLQKICSVFLLVGLSFVGVLAIPSVSLADPVHNRPSTTASLSPNATSPGQGLSFYSDPVTVTLTATADPNYSIGATYYILDGGAQQTYTGPFTVSGIGQHGFSYWSVDNSGIEELNHQSMGFAIGYQHGTILSINQDGINLSATVNFDNFQQYLSHIIWGADCYLDFGSFELHDAATGAIVVNQPNSNSHCGNAGNGNTWLAFPPTGLQSGTYWIHYTGGGNDWITDPFTYTAPVLHNPPVSSASITSTPNQPGAGLVLYPDPTTVVINATADTGYSISAIYYKVDGGATQTYSGPFTVSGVGKHSFEYWSVDNTNFEEPTHHGMGFAIGAQHGTILSMAQDGNFMDISVNFENFSQYLSQIIWGPDCYLDFGSFEMYDATTGARVASQPNGNSHCGNAGNGNTWLSFPPLQLATGTYWIHYSGGSYDWITDNFSYTAPVPAHNTPVTTSSLSPNPTSPGQGLSFYSDPVTVTLTATPDTGYTIDHTYYRVDGGPQQDYTGPFTVTGLGKHGVEYWSIDTTGISEAQHRSVGFAINYRHGTILSMAQNPISMDISVHFDDFQQYLNTIIWGADCYLDFGSFEMYNAATNQRVSTQPNGNSHCGNAGNGNTWLAFPPLLLPPGTYWIHYSGGSDDWITDPFVYAPTPKTTLNLAGQMQDETYPNPTTASLSVIAAVGTTIAATYYSVDGGATQTYTGPFTVSGGGLHHIDYWSVDNGGITEPHQTQPFTIHSSQVLGFHAAGSNSRSTSGNSSLTVTLNSSAVPGDTEILSVTTGTFAGATGCTDSKGNTYHVIADKNTGNGRLFICSAAVTTALAAGDTITATYPGFSGLSVASASMVNGLDTPGSVDTSSTGSGSNPTVSSGNVTPSQAKAVIFGAVSHSGVSTFAPTAMYTVLGEATAGSGAGTKTVTPVYAVVNATTPVAVSGALSGSGFWQAAAVVMLATGAN